MTKADAEAIRGSLDALNRAFVTNARDWGANRTEAWLWGIVVGWDNDGDDGSIAELAARFGWNRAAVAQLRAERAGFAQIEQLLTEVAELRAFAEAADTSGVTRDDIAQRSRRQLVDTVLAQAGAVRLLQQEWANAGAEAAKLRARIDELETTVSILEDSDPFSYDDCRDDCDGCHEGQPMCDCHVPAKEARVRIRDLRDRVEAGEVERDLLRAVLDEAIAERRKLYRWERQAAADVAALREQVADALALCAQTRPDSVIGTSDTERLKAVRERLAMTAGGGA